MIHRTPHYNSAPWKEKVYLDFYFKPFIQCLLYCTLESPGEFKIISAPWALDSNIRIFFFNSSDDPKVPLS